MSTITTTPQESPQDIVSRSKRLGIALSGGGARGLAHAGALIAIEQAGLKPDVIAGVSAGSVIAVLYAAGVRPIDMPALFAQFSFGDFTEINLGKGGLFKMNKFGDYIMSIIGGKTKLEQLNIPTYIGATDIDNARGVAFSSGDIKPRMMASCSIPVVFPPINIDGVNYVDGGVLRNHPAWILRDKCDLLIGINVSPIRKTKKYGSIVDVAMRTYNLMAKANQSQDMALCDVSVQTTDLIEHKVFSLKHIKDVVMSGYRHTRRALVDAGLWNPVDHIFQQAIAGTQMDVTLRNVGLNAANSINANK